MKIATVIAGMAVCLLGVSWSPAQAQFSDPRGYLGTLIQAFQNCGPSTAYQGLSPQVYQYIAMQTGGSGCYQAVQMLGQVNKLTVENQIMMPVGPLYSVRAEHASGTQSIWQIGFSRISGQVEYINFQPAQTSQGPKQPDPKTLPKPGRETLDGCVIYKVMCE
ncbi:hypothetical protein LOK46_22510 [Methylobacterium sp. NMS14P]|uniref:hypothetical protein n=1 Tax=Methylobacterium sp. NMS14P TaxID=2894310 RepID=UPI002358F0E8|nr:hypothetical protein [Methylobacterium sp. NMS14P]WCS23897.1 hypothetical protein LOK46_22510 [Methylobacterium sp. NMS14P]